MENSDFLRRTGYYIAVCVKNVEGLKERNTLLAVYDWTDDDLHRVKQGLDAFTKSMRDKEVVVKHDDRFVWFRTVDESPYEARLVPAASLHEGAMKDFIDNVADVTPMGVSGCLGNAYVDPANWPGLVKYVEDGAIAVHDRFSEPGSTYHQYLSQLWYR